jgi:polysaccharide export outer membrane protein
VIRINVYQNPDLTLETRVTEAGVVSYPLLGSMRLGGLSVTAAEKLIADGLRTATSSRARKSPLVVMQVRGNQASVLGQVNRPGRYPLEVADMRLTDLLAMAGGTAAGGADLVVVTGTRNGQPFRLEVDLPTVFAAGGRDKDIMHPQRRHRLGRPPAHGLHLRRSAAPRPDAAGTRMTLMQALATGGGLTQRGTEKGIRVHRKAADGAVQVIESKMDDKLREGDVVFVRESLF